MTRITGCNVRSTNGLGREENYEKKNGETGERASEKGGRQRGTRGVGRSKISRKMAEKAIEIEIRKSKKANLLRTTSEKNIG